MTNVITSIFNVIISFQPLDWWDAADLGSRLFAPLELPFDLLVKATELPVVGTLFLVWLAIVDVIFAIVGAVVTLVLAVGSYFVYDLIAQGSPVLVRLEEGIVLALRALGVS